VAENFTPLALLGGRGIEATGLEVVRVRRNAVHRAVLVRKFYTANHPPCRGSLQAKINGKSGGNVGFGVWMGRISLCQGIERAGAAGVVRKFYPAGADRGADSVGGLGRGAVGLRRWRGVAGPAGIDGNGE
jgi:hypothetical protein